MVKSLNFVRIIAVRIPYGEIITLVTKFRALLQVSRQISLPLFLFCPSALSARSLSRSLVSHSVASVCVSVCICLSFSLCLPFPVCLSVFQSPLSLLTHLSLPFSFSLLNNFSFLLLPLCPIVSAFLSLTLPYSISFSVSLCLSIYMSIYLYLSLTLRLRLSVSPSLCLSITPSLTV